MDLKEYLQLILAVILIFLLVYLPFANYARSIYLKSVFSGKQTRLNEGEIQLGEGKNTVVLSPQKIVYVQSEGNYLDIFCLAANTEITKITVRSTLSGLQQILETDFPSFKRVHRSYLVNMNFYHKLITEKGNTQIQLKVNDEYFTFPVSRKYKSVIKEIL
ncbi:LytR/AlgR family response regulator transcription factor [Robertkochia aurantiaca]|uniref:LytR/AlgR family response regulator transcription factor n=1 Tax=Robertkochia aurantiaca TaxID=2873700 RepID=UPI001CCB32FB|nr:LytTR family DNA-binding domain-containing protein [Robertkochia sp. 3YJGBD-33]